MRVKRRARFQTGNLQVFNWIKNERKVGESGGISNNYDIAESIVFRGFLQPKEFRNNYTLSGYAPESTYLLLTSDMFSFSSMDRILPCNVDGPNFAYHIVSVMKYETYYALVLEDRGVK